MFSHTIGTTHTDIRFTRTAERIVVRADHSDLDIEVRFGSNELNFPAKSIFKNWQEARRFAGPLPFTFSYSKSSEKY